MAKEGDSIEDSRNLVIFKTIYKFARVLQVQGPLAILFPCQLSSGKVVGNGVPAAAAAIIFHIQFR